MKPHHCLAALLLVALAALAVPADKDKDDGFVPMFDGQTLKGWVNVNCAPSTFYVKDGEIITTGKPTGYLRTDRQYENFIAEFDWMHVPPKPDAVGNSGFFVWADPIPAVGTGYTRGIEVQVLVNLEKKDHYTSQGDLFSIWGAHCTPDRPHPQGWERCLPSENRCKGANEWNHYRVEANDGVIKLHVNGKEVSGVSKCTPRKGYLALESEGSECHFKNLKIKELPSTNPKPDEVADEDRGFKSLYTGLDLSGWKADDEAKKHWQPKDTVLHFDGQGKELRTEKEYGDAEFVVDFRFPQNKDAPCSFAFREWKGGELKLTLTPGGRLTGFGTDGQLLTSENLKPAGQWNRLQLTLKGKEVTLTINRKPVSIAKAEFKELPPKGAFRLLPEGEMDFANLFVRELK